MTGPVVIVAVGLVVGAVLGGVAGAAGGVVIGLGLVAAIVASMATWAQQIGGRLAPEDAREAAPRPWGFGAVSRRIYGRFDA